MTKASIRIENNTKHKRWGKALIGLFSSFLYLHLSATGPPQKNPEVPYVPTPEKVIAKMLRVAKVGKDDVLYDLGCGDGRIVITAVKELGCRGVGIDVNPVRIKESRENAVEAGVSDRAEFFLMDLFDADISRATVVTLYLLSDVNVRLRPKLLRELSPGTRVVSHDFGMGAWTPDEDMVIDDDSNAYVPFYDTFVLDFSWGKHKVHLWIIPANVTGVWQWTMPANSGKKSYTVELEQIFQEVRGKALEGSLAIPMDIKNGKIKGNRLEFSLERKLKGRLLHMQFEGFVRGHTMDGFVSIVEEPGVKNKWRAKRVLSTFKPIDG